MKTMIAAVMVAGALVAGCATPTGPYTPYADTLPTANYPNITADGELAGFLAVNPPTITKDPVMAISVPVRLLSRQGHWAKVQYRFIFLDGSYVPLKGQPDWQAVTMEPQQQVFMTGNALDTNAVNWRLEIRPQR